MNRQRAVLTAVVLGASALAALVGVACVGDSPTQNPPDGGGGSDAGSDQVVPSDAKDDASACGDCDGATCFDGVCGGNQVVGLAAGGAACVVLKSGAVYCWGADDQHQLGGTGAGDGTCDDFGTTKACRFAPARVTGISSATQVSLGASSACAVLGDATVSCWGSNSGSPLGHDPQTDATCNGLPCNGTPSTVAGLANVSQVSVGDGWACALKKSPSR